jgi:hypothetical protein
VSRRQAGRWAQQDQQEAAALQPAAGATDDTLAQLRQLGELKSQGVLSEDEFEQQKRRILSS